MSETLHDLADRAEAGSGPDRELDSEIYWHAVCATHPQYRERDGVRQINLAHSSREPDWRPYAEANMPGVTWSIDAVEALRMRLLPHVDVEVWRSPDSVGCTIWLETPEGEDGSIGHSACATESRARLAALLRAIAGGVDG